MPAGAGRSPPAPASFVPARYAGYLEKARQAGDDIGFRHYWELWVILGLRDGLWSGDIFVPGSRRYADPSTYLYTPEQWMPRQGEYCRLVGKPARAADAIAQGKEELHAAPAELENTLAGALPDDAGTVRLDGDDKLVIPKLTVEDVPAEASELKDELAGMLSQHHKSLTLVRAEAARPWGRRDGVKWRATSARRSPVPLWKQLTVSTMPAADTAGGEGAVPLVLLQTRSEQLVDSDGQ